MAFETHSNCTFSYMEVCVHIVTFTYLRRFLKYLANDGDNCTIQRKRMNIIVDSFWFDDLWIPTMTVIQQIAKCVFLASAIFYFYANKQIGTMRIYVFFLLVSLLFDFRYRQIYISTRYTVVNGLNTNGI